MTSLITKTCLSLRSIASARHRDRRSACLVHRSHLGRRGPGTASRSIPFMAGSACVNGSMIHRCRGRADPDWSSVVAASGAGGRCGIIAA
jgi:hypothetical protein